MALRSILTKWLTVSMSSAVKRPTGTHKMMDRGLLAIYISLFHFGFLRFLYLVSNTPGVSTTFTCRPNLSTSPNWHVAVTDALCAPNLNAFCPSIVLAVLLFPLPVFPSNTILNSLLGGSTILSGRK